MHTPKEDGQTRRHRKARHLKANREQDGNRGASATVACSGERTFCVCAAQVEMCGWPGVVGGQCVCVFNVT